MSDQDGDEEDIFDWEEGGPPPPADTARLAIADFVELSSSNRFSSSLRQLSALQYVRVDGAFEDALDVQGPLAKFAQALAACSNVDCVDFESFNFNSGCCRMLANALQRMPKFESLHLTKCFFEEGSLSDLLPRIKLCDLSLRGWLRGGSPPLAGLASVVARCPTLRALSFCEYKFDEGDFEALMDLLPRLPALELLKFAHLRSALVYDNVMTHRKYYKQFCNEAVLALLKVLPRCARLSSLSLMRIAGFSGTICRNLAETLPMLTELRELNLEDTEVRASDLPALSPMLLQCLKLKDLKLSVSCSTAVVATFVTHFPVHHPLAASLQKMLRQHRQDAEEFGSDSDGPADPSDEDLPDLDEDHKAILGRLGPNRQFIQMRGFDDTSVGGSVASRSNLTELSAACDIKQQGRSEPASTGGILCIACKATLPKDSFSKAQLTKHRGSSKCKSCVQSMPSA